MTDHPEQNPLFEQPQPVTPPKPLTEKQQRGYNLAKTTPGGITADELGAIEHERRGKHHRDQRCDWCASEGKGVLESVAVRPLLVRQRGSGRYSPCDGSGAPVVPRSGQLGELPGESWESIFGSEAA